MINTFTSISDRIKYKRDQTMYIVSKSKPAKSQFKSFELKQSYRNAFCNCK